MANEFIARNGLIAQTNSKISGSLTQGVPGNTASGSYSHAEGGDEAFLDISQTIDINNYSALNTIQFGPISGDPVFISTTYNVVSLPGDLTSLIELPYTLTDLYLSSSLYNFSVDLDYFPPTPIITSMVFSGGSTAFTFSPMLAAEYYPLIDRSNKALGISSHAEGVGTTALGDYQHVQGQYNVTSSVQSAFIHGNGTSDSARSNLIYAHDSVVEITGSLNITGSLLVNGVEPGGGGTGAGFPYSGSAVITGSLLVSGSSTVTGSLNVTQGITGSLLGTASYARYPFITETVTGPTNAGSLPNTDYIYLVNATTTITLPTAVGNTSRYDIKNIGTSTTASIATSLSQTIDGSTPPILLRVRYTSLTIVSNGTSWNII